MKINKKVTVFFIGLFAIIGMLFMPNDANAENVAPIFSKYKLGGIPQLVSVNNKSNNDFVALSNTNADYQEVNFEVSLNARDLEELTTTILAQKPGDSQAESKANNGTFYFSVTPDMDFSSYTKRKYTFSSWFNSDASPEAVKAELTNVRNNGLYNSTQNSSWNQLFRIQYFDNLANEWKTPSDESIGNVSIGDYIASKVGVDGVEDLVYGKNYRITILDNQSIFKRYSMKDSSEKIVEQIVKYNFSVNVSDLPYHKISGTSIVPVMLSDYDKDVQITTKERISNQNNATTSFVDGQYVVDTTIASVNITDDDLVRILNDKPGNSNAAASLGVFYYNMYPNVDKAGFETLKKEFSHSFSIDADEGTLAARKADFESRILAKGYTANKDLNLWLENFKIQYFDGNTWQDVTQKSNGGISIGDNLISILGTNKLVYGVNYRLCVISDLSYYAGWDFVDKNDNVERLLVRVNQKANLAVYADITKTNETISRQVFFNSLEEGLESTERVIYVTKDTQLNNATNLENHIVILKDGAKLTLSATLDKSLASRIDYSDGELYFGTEKYVPTKQPTPKDVVVDDKTKEVLKDIDKIKVEGTFDVPVDVHIKAISLDTLEDSFVSTMISNIESLFGKGAKVVLLDINALSINGNVKVQPTDGTKVTVTLPVPEGFDIDKSVLVYVDENGKVVELHVTLNDDGTITFETSHFSYFAFVEKTGTNPIVKPKPSEPKEPIDKGTMLPTTGASNMPIILFVGLIMSSGALVYIKKKFN